jgi:DNA processing protein
MSKLLEELADVLRILDLGIHRGLYAVGTWAGAVEQLDKYRFVPVYVRSGGGGEKDAGSLHRQATTAF